jgi:hypothetical protein
MFRCQLFPSPQGCETGNWIKISQIRQPCDRPVVVSAYKNVSQLARPLNDFIRTGAIADDVAQIDDQVMGWGRIEASLQGFEIRVNVAEQKNAHMSPDKLPIIDLKRAWLKNALVV